MAIGVTSGRTKSTSAQRSRSGETSVTQPVKRRRVILKGVVGLAFGGLLCWLIVTHTLAAYLAVVAPELALRIHPHHPLAGVRLADRRLAIELAEAIESQKASRSSKPRRLNFGGPIAQDKSADVKPSDQPVKPGPPQVAGDVRRQIKRLVEPMLVSDPLNARALRILGQLALLEDNTAKAATFMRAAASLTPRESTAALWVMQHSFQQKDYPTTIHYADSILRTTPRLSRYVVPLLAHLAEDAAQRASIVSLLQSDPPWRARFLAQMTDSISDSRTPMMLLLDLRQAQSPPTRGELAQYLRFLLARKNYELAYYTWLQFLPPERLTQAALLFNGQFELSPSGLPFDWALHAGSGATIAIVPRIDRRDGQALRIDFQHGRVAFRGATQMTMIAPGTYRFKGKLRGKLSGKRGLKWRISCADKPHSVLGESQMFVGLAPQWQRFSFDVEVPPEGCRAQQVRLLLDARSASEQLVSGSVFYDDLQIVRVETN